jgi:hypothetical protein
MSYLGAAVWWYCCPVGRCASAGLRGNDIEQPLQCCQQLQRLRRLVAYASMHAAADPAGADLVSLQQYTCSSSSSSGGRGSACTRPKGWCEVTGVPAVAPTH